MSGRSSASSTGLEERCEVGIELADGIGFVAEEFDAHGALGFGRVDVEDAAAQGVLAGHFDDVGGGVADGVQVGEQSVEVERFAAANGAGEVGVIVARAQTDGCGGDGRDDDGSGAGGDFPESGGAFFLEFGMRREILERKHVAGGERDDGVGIAGGSEFAEAAENGDEIFDGAIVVDYEDQRAGGGALKQHEQQGFCCGSEAGDTNAAPCPPGGGRLHA